MTKKSGYKIKDFLIHEKFYRVPKSLMLNEKYKKLSSDAVLMYAIFQDRYELSLKNKWFDENGYVYFYFTIDSMMEIMNKSRNSIIKAKKELVKFELLSEVRQGLKKPNKLYLLKEESIDNKGSSNCELQEVHNLNSNDTDINYTFKDTNKDTISNTVNKTNIDNLLLDNFTNYYQDQLVTEKLIELFSNFGSVYELKDNIDIIYSTKRKVENYQNKEQPNKNLRYQIDGEMWKYEIEKYAFKAVFKMKESNTKDKKFNFKNYWFSVMENFWESVLLMEKKYGYSQLEFWASTGCLELEDNFIQMNRLLKDKAKKDKQKIRYDLVYCSSFQEEEVK
ncbi:replication initiator protein A [Vagococcus zengguangii]|uniref:Replication initiator A N-terminal domain-containing protein n=1 Tax=Vagococcus zengguangii TaxID=2571750 RepID=A0A4D7CXX6_9ENTE|nr:replication initiator protein A [Vagococcus zengguangii]QCI86636.1 hypothetical protein FA707_06475 [Vagococcus zengguangii]